MVEGPRTWQEVEEGRAEFVEILDAQVANVVRVLTSVRDLGFTPADVARLEKARDEVQGLRALLVSHWPAFTRSLG